MTLEHHRCVIVIFYCRSVSFLFYHVVCTNKPKTEQEADNSEKNESQKVTMPGQTSESPWTQYSGKDLIWGEFLGERVRMHKKERKTPWFVGSFISVSGACN